MDYYKKHIKIERAPEPEDVIFENLEVSQLKRFSKTIVGSILSLIYCSVCSAFTFILYFLQKITDKRKEQSKKTILLYLMSFIITIITSAIDFSLEILLEKPIKNESLYTWTHYYTNYSINLAFFSFYNSAIFPVIAESMIFKSDGFVFLINNMLMKFLVNSFVTPIMWSINFKFLYKKNARSI